MTSVETDLPSADVVARLERLAELHDRGALDDQEYEIAKNAVLHDEDEQWRTRARVALLALQAVAIAAGIWLGSVIWTSVS